MKRIGLCFVPLGLAGCRTTESYRAGCPDKAWPAHSFIADRAAVQNPIREQAANGASLYATIFNYYYEVETSEHILDKDGVWTGRDRPLAQPKPTARLSPWGKELLNRLARQSDGQQLCVSIQTGMDIASVTRAPGAAAKARAELDAMRVQAVQVYLAELRPDLLASVDVTDPNPVGMSGKESRVGFDKMLTAPTGNLSQSAILGTDIGTGGSPLQGGSTTGPGPGQTAAPSPQEPPPPPSAPAGGLAPGPAPSPAAAPSPQELPPPDAPGVGLAPGPAAPRQASQ